MKTVDLTDASVTKLNQALHAQAIELVESDWTVLNPKGEHNLAVGLDATLNVTIDGPTGYFAAGMNKTASVTITDRKSVV